MASKPKWTKSHWSVNLLGLLHNLLHFVLFCQVIAVSKVFRVWLKLPDDEFALLHSLSNRFVADYRCYNSRPSETRQDCRKRPSGAFTLTTRHDNKLSRIQSTHPAELSSGGVCYSPLKSRFSWKVCLHRPIYEVCRHSAIPIYFQLALIDYGKNHNHNYIGQYCNHDYLTRLLVGHMTKSLYEWFI